VPLAQLPASVSIAQTAAELQRIGLLTDDPVFVDEHLDAILVHRDPRLLAALRRRVLTPLDGQAPASRERLVETLRAWLRHFGDRRAIAQELHVHPQTVRYRMGQLHTLFGSRLDSPEFRAQLMLALAWGIYPADSEAADGEPATDGVGATGPGAAAGQRVGGTTRATGAARQLPPKRTASRR
jgi:sugar diacid utilization regulator